MSTNKIGYATVCYRPVADVRALENYLRQELLTYVVHSLFRLCVAEYAVTRLEFFARHVYSDKFSKNGKPLRIIIDSNLYPLNGLVTTSTKVVIPFTIPLRHVTIFHI